MNQNLSYLKKIQAINTFGFWLEVHLAEHCNLNCKGCSHFSPLAEKEFIEEKIPAAPDDIFPARVIPEARLIKRQLHEPPKRDRPRAADFRGDQL